MKKVKQNNFKDLTKLFLSLFSGSYLSIAPMTSGPIKNYFVSNLNQFCVDLIKTLVSELHVTMKGGYD